MDDHQHSNKKGEKNGDELERIASALERIADAVERGSSVGGEISKICFSSKESARKRNSGNGNKSGKLGTIPSRSTDGQGVSKLIGCYVEGWQRRYQTKARPEVTKCIGVFKSLLTERGAEEISQLLQVYFQLTEPWFETKRHDIVTFKENIGKIALAHDKGLESTHVNWDRVFGDTNADSKSRFLAADGPDEEDVGRAQLSRGENGDLLESVSDGFGREPVGSD